MTDAEPFFDFAQSRFTTTLDFVECRFDTCLDGLTGVRDRIASNWAAIAMTEARDVPPRRYAGLTFAEKLRSLEPLETKGLSRILLTEAHNGWCCAMGNGWHGIGIADWIEMSAEARRVRFFRLAVDETKGNETVQFVFKDFSTSPPKERVVYVYSEGGRQFFQHGSALPFEVTEAYSRPRKRDRLTAAVLTDYAAALGVDLRREDPFQGVSAVIDLLSAPRHENAVAKLGLTAWIKTLTARLFTGR